MEARNRNLSDWFSLIRAGSVALPRFQRYEAWTHQQVSGLLDTVLNGLPAGAVLILEIGDEEPFISRSVKGAPPLSKSVNEHLLDGQQRLTALWRSLHANYPDRAYFVQVSEDELAFSCLSQSRWMKKDRLFPVWADIPKDQWARRLIPVHLLRPDPQAEMGQMQWMQEVSDGDMELHLKLMQLIAKLRMVVSTFNVPFLSMPRTTAKDTALNVFIQMNTSAAPLTAYDIVVAQVEAGTGQSLHDLVADVNQAAPHAARLMDPADWSLAIAALLQDKVPNRSTYLESGFSEGLIKDWDRIKVGIKRATEFLFQERVFDNQRLPTDVVLYPLAALWSDVPDGLDAEGVARSLLKRFVWRAFVTERYERTSATRALVDYRDLSRLIHEPDASQPLMFDEEVFPLPTVEEVKQAGWPKRKDRLSRAILAISLRADAYDFADGRPVDPSELERREYHHLFPDAWLTKKEYSKSQIYRALNCALVTWRTNRNMSDKAPSKYLAERLTNSEISEQMLISRMESHFIPYQPVKTDNYEAFLSQRAKIMVNMMRKLCDGEVWSVEGLMSPAESEELYLAD